MTKKLLFTVLMLFVLVSLSGCITLKKGDTTTTSNLGGVFLSVDKADVWKHRSLLMTPGEQAGAITDSDVYFIRFDPTNSKVIYTGTKKDGLYVSYNAGAGWTKVEALPAGFIRDLVIDPKAHCTLYGAVHNRIYKSIDCGREWASIWYSDNAEKVVASLDIDWYDTNIIYAGVSDGSVLKSGNKGATWTKTTKFDDRVNKIVVDPNDSRIVYAGVLNKGLYRTDDKAENWVDLNSAMKDFKRTSFYYDFVVSKSNKNEVIYASKFGLIRSKDRGETWTAIELNSSAGEEEIFSVAIDPTNANYIYYGTDTALYKTIDGGATWAVKRMPTTRVAGEILVYPEDTKNIFMGAKTLVQ
jgi:photosystem II stability/assembly factor-like uncharacterized protein